MRGPEIRYWFYQFVMFQPTPPLEAGPRGSGVTEPIHMTADRLGVYLSRNMYSGPIRFRALVDVDEEEVAAEFGPHERREATVTLHSIGGSYSLLDLNGTAKVLEQLDEGEYRVILFSSGVDRKNWDHQCRTSKERYWLILQPQLASTDGE
jgi:hypothetical protein